MRGAPGIRRGGGRPSGSRRPDGGRGLGAGRSETSRAAVPAAGQQGPRRRRGLPDPAAARRLLVRRCVLHASRERVPVAGDDLPAEAVAGLAQRMVEHDPQAEVLLDLSCPACEHDWQALFDIVAFFWAELAARADRLLREVHALARAYGWREADILGMSPHRRRFYLEMVT